MKIAKRMTQLAQAVSDIAKEKEELRAAEYYPFLLQQIEQRARVGHRVFQTYDLYEGAFLNALMELLRSGGFKVDWKPRNYGLSVISLPAHLEIAW